MAKARRTFTPEFKVQAVKLVTEQGKSIAEVARDLDLGESLLRSWKQALAAGGDEAFPGQRVTNPARQSLASSRKRVLRGEGRPSLRSVDSECQGRAIEPRKLLVGALVVDDAGAAPAAPQWSWRAVPPGSESRAKAHEGSPGTWEALPSPPTCPARETG